MTRKAIAAGATAVEIDTEPKLHHHVAFQQLKYHELVKITGFDIFGLRYELHRPMVYNRGEANFAD